MADTRFGRRVEKRRDVKITTGTDRRSGDRRLLLSFPVAFTIFWEIYFMDESRIPSLFFFFFFLRFVFLTTFDTLSCTIDRFRNNQKLSREYGLTSVEAPGNTRNASRISSISGRKSERSWKQIYWNNRTDSCEIVLPTVKISLDKISKILRLWKFFVKLGKRFEKYSRVK